MSAPRFDKNPYTIADIVSIYIEPSLGLKIEDARYNNQKVIVGLSWEFTDIFM